MATIQLTFEKSEQKSCRECGEKSAGGGECAGVVCDAYVMGHVTRLNAVCHVYECVCVCVHVYGARYIYE